MLATRKGNLCHRHFARKSTDQHDVSVTLGIVFPEHQVATYQDQQEQQRHARNGESTQGGTVGLHSPSD